MAIANVDVDDDGTWTLGGDILKGRPIGKCGEQMSKFSNRMMTHASTQSEADDWIGTVIVE